LYQRCTIVAFEPDIDNFPLFKENITKNSIQGVTYINAALWSEKGTLTLYRAKGDAWRVDVGCIERDGDQYESYSVPTVPLAPYFVGHGIVDFFKLDVEGAEESVLVGLADELDRVKQIVFEYHEAGTLGRIKSLLKSHGFVEEAAASKGDRRPASVSSFINKKLGSRG